MAKKYPPQPDKNGYRKRLPKTTHAVFSIRFTEGLAIRNRLPLDHVIRVLTELKGMIESVGKQVQRERGVAAPTGDFGLELLGGFRKGSVKAAFAITKDVDAGIIAASQVIDAVSRLNGVAPKRRAKKVDTQNVSRGDYDPRLVARLGNISKVQEIDKTRLEMKLAGGGAIPLKAVFDRRTTKIIDTLREPNFGIEELTVFGKLRVLKDRFADGNEDKNTFTGELAGDDGTTWRVEFKAKDLAEATQLFRRQVWVTGNAVYYKAQHPKIIPTAFGLDEERDYSIAFDELYGAAPELANTDLKTLIRELETD